MIYALGKSEVQGHLKVKMLGFYQFFGLFLDILTFIWPWISYLSMLYVSLSLANNLSVITYQNNEVTATRKPTIHIHINKSLWKQLIDFPAFSFFESHHFLSQVGPDKNITLCKMFKPSHIVHNQILVFVLTISKIVWSKCVPYCTCFCLKITFSLKIHEKIVKIDKKQNPLKSIAENGSSLPQCIWIVCATPELVCGGGY